MAHTGSCECGAVRYEISGVLRPVILCHCSQCRKTSGHFWAATSVPTKNLTITCDDGLVWYRSSEIAQRGFCSICGASLFYRRDDRDNTAIGAGTLDGPTGLHQAEHIFVDDKGDYYDIADGVPHRK